MVTDSLIFRNKFSHTVGKPTQQTVGNLFFQIQRYVCNTTQFIRRSLVSSETERKLDLPRLSCDSVKIAQLIGKTIAKRVENETTSSSNSFCSKNRTSRTSVFTKPVGHAWILLERQSWAPLGSPILIATPLKCSLFFVRKGNKLGRYLAIRESCAVSAPQPPRRSRELERSGLQNPGLMNSHQYPNRSGELRKMLSQEPRRSSGTADDEIP